jgi:hypothetical protein
MTPTSVGLVLVEGQDADGATMDRDAFDVHKGSIQCSEQATAAVLRTEALAANRGLRLNSIGVTWSEDADAEASALMQSLSDSGFDNVVAIRLPEATEALARGMAAVIGYQTTAVCVIEPDAVISLVVNTSDGAVQTAFNHSIDSDESLISWLSTVFTKADWQPEALVVVGSAGGFESILHKLEDALSVPVFAPAEAELALARGAALASAQTIELPLVDYSNDYSDFSGEYAHEYGYDKTRSTGRHRTAEPSEERSARLGHTGAVTMLVAGVLTFVVSVSIAVSLEFAPHRDARSADPVPAAVNEAQTRAAIKPIPPAMPPPVTVPPPQAVEPVAPPPEAPVVDAAPPETYVPAEAPIIDQAPIADSANPVAPPADLPPVDPALTPPPPPEALVPSPDGVPTIDSTVPTKKPGIWTRIKDRLTPGNDNPPVEVAPPPAEVVPPPVP